MGVWEEGSRRVPESSQSSAALGGQTRDDFQTREDCRTLSSRPGWASGYVKPLTPHGGWWTSSRYQVFSLWHSMLYTAEELRTEWGPGVGGKGREGRGRGGARWFPHR